MSTTNKHNYHRLFILGAGFSKPAGLPLATELFKQLDRISPLQQDIQDWKKLYPNEEIDLERVLAFSHRRHYLGLEGSNVMFAYGSTTNVFVNREIQKILIRDTPLNIPNLYKKFTYKLTPFDTVFTFNYDTLLEQALDDIGKPYTLTPEWWLEDFSIDQKYVDVLKLHGSIDWYDRDYYDLMQVWDHEEGTSVAEHDPIFGSKAVASYESLAKGPVQKLYGRKIVPRVCRVLNHKNFIEQALYRDSLLTVPFVLPLAHDKLLGYSPVVDFWHGLDQAMWEVPTIVLIGYSMPRHDSYAYEALGNFLYHYQLAEGETRFNQVRKPVQVITMADSKESALKDMPFLDRQKTRVWCQGFSEDTLEWIDWGDGAS